MKILSHETYPKITEGGGRNRVILELPMVKWFEIEDSSNLIINIKF